MGVLEHVPNQGLRKLAIHSCDHEWVVASFCGTPFSAPLDDLADHLGSGRFLFATARSLFARASRNHVHASAISGDTTCLVLGDCLAVFTKHVEQPTILKLPYEGGRPLAVAFDESSVVFGEYRRNMERSNINLWSIDVDTGRATKISEVPAVRHVHSVSPSIRGGWWVMTGDEDGESRIERRDDDWNIQSIYEYGQRTRAIAAVETDDGLVFGTDDPDGTNYLSVLSNDGPPKVLTECDSPLYSMVRWRNFLVAVTASEDPTRHSVRVLVANESDLSQWEQAIVLTADSLPMRLFGYGRLRLSSSSPDGNLYASATGLKEVQGHIDLAPMIIEASESLNGEGV